MKNTYKYIFTTLLIFSFLSACSSDKETEKIAINQIPVQDLPMDRLSYLPDAIAPDIYMLTDNLLLVLPYRSSTIIKVFDINSKTLINDRIKTYEYQMPVTSDTNVQATYAFLNKSTNAYVEYELNEGNLQLKRNISMGDLQPDDVRKVGEHIYINLGQYKEGLFRVLDNEKKSIKAYGNFPFKPNPNRPQPDMNKGYMDMIENEIYFVSHYFGYMASYRYKDNKLKINWEKFHTDSMSDDPPVYHDIIAKEKHIYVLCSRNPFPNPEETKYSILVFDRKGNPVFNCSLPDTVQHIAIDSQEEYIYTSSDTNGRGTYLARFRIADIQE